MVKLVFYVFSFLVSIIILFFMKEIYPNINSYEVGLLVRRFFLIGAIIFILILLIAGFIIQKINQKNDKYGKK